MLNRITDALSVIFLLAALLLTPIALLEIDRSGVEVEFARSPLAA